MYKYKYIEICDFLRRLFNRLWMNDPLARPWSPSNVWRCSDRGPPADWSSRSWSERSSAERILKTEIWRLSVGHVLFALKLFVVYFFSLSQLMFSFFPDHLDRLAGGLRGPIQFVSQESLAKRGDHTRSILGRVSRRSNADCICKPRTAACWRFARLGLPGGARKIMGKLWVEKIEVPAFGLTQLFMHFQSGRFGGKNMYATDNYLEIMRHISHITVTFSPTCFTCLALGFFRNIIGSQHRPRPVTTHLRPKDKNHLWNWLAPWSRPLWGRWFAQTRLRRIGHVFNGGRMNAS